MSNTLVKTIKFPNIDLKDGSSLFFGEDLPFTIKRIFYLYGFQNDDMLRGDHAHYQCKQLIFCLDGKYVLKLDNGIKKEYMIHSSKVPNTGILIDPLIWVRLENIRKDTKILVLASHKYDESDYIRNYNNFKDIVTK